MGRWYSILAGFQLSGSSFCNHLDTEKEVNALRFSPDYLPMFKPDRELCLAMWTC